MKSTTRLINNLSNEDFRRSKVDLSKAVEHVIKTKVEYKKKEYIDNMNKK